MILKPTNQSEPCLNCDDKMYMPILVVACLKILIWVALYQWVFNFKGVGTVV